MSQRLEIDGRDVTDECASFVWSIPNLVYAEDNGVAAMRFLGAQGFQLTLIDPADWLRALVDGGVTRHTVRVIDHGHSITHAVQFHREWECADGTRKVFASLADERASVAKWIPEPDMARL